MKLSSTALRLLGVLLLTGTVSAQDVTYERLLNADNEPQNWLTYSGSYHGQRYSTLDADHAGERQEPGAEMGVSGALAPEKFEATPLVVDGVMYITQPPNDIVALDAKTGRIFWIYQYRLPATARGPCCGRNNRGLAILGNTLFMGTIDAHLVAIDAKNGHPLGRASRGQRAGVFADRGAAGRERQEWSSARPEAKRASAGFVAAYSADTGREVWKFNTIPGPGEPGNETWAGDTWKHGGGSSWMTGSYDPDLNLIFWGTGNPWPDSSGQPARATISTPVRRSRSMPTPAS